MGMINNTNFDEDEDDDPSSAQVEMVPRSPTPPIPNGQGYSGNAKNAVLLNTPSLPGNGVLPQPSILTIRNNFRNNQKRGISILENNATAAFDEEDDVDVIMDDDEDDAEDSWDSGTDQEAEEEVVIPMDDLWVTHIVEIGDSQLESNLTRRGETSKVDPPPTFEDSLGNKWGLNIFLKGYSLSDTNFVSIFVAPVNGNHVERKTKFVIDLIDPDDDTKFASKYVREKEKKSKQKIESRLGEVMSNVFTSSDFGNSRYIQRNLFDRFVDPQTGLAKLLIRLRVKRDSLDLSFQTLDAKLPFVGLSNQGATCYMNSLLQTLYHTRGLRKAVYELNTSADKAEVGVALELQRLFTDLQTKSTAVSTKSLTKAFGWTDADVFFQHDAQELLRMLLDKLNDRMKGTPHEKTMTSLFCGEFETAYRCEHVNFEKVRKEEFFDLQLDVRGVINVDEALMRYVREERLEGENAYEADGFGKQSTIKTVRFVKLPPVMHLLLKRFDFDWQTNKSFKIDDRFDFPEKLDMNPYVSENLRGPNNVFLLHSVLVHSGDVHRGHYYAFVRPEKQNRWFKFDDQNVSKASKRQAIRNNFGHGTRYHTSKTKRSKLQTSYSPSLGNAYMLAYVRESSWGQAMPTVDSVPDSLLARFIRDKTDRENQKIQEEKARFRFVVRIARMSNVEDFRGYDVLENLSEDWVRWGDCDIVVVDDTRQCTTAHAFYQIVGSQLGLSAGTFRLWKIFSRASNRTARMEEPLRDDTSTTSNFKLDEKYFVQENLPESDVYNEDELCLLFREFNPSLPGVVPNKAYFMSHTGLYYASASSADLWTCLSKILPLDQNPNDYDLFELVTLWPLLQTSQVLTCKNDPNIALLARMTHCPQDPSFKSIVDGQFVSAGDIVMFSRKANKAKGEKNCAEYFYQKLHTVTVSCRDLLLHDAYYQTEQEEIALPSTFKVDVLNNKPLDEDLLERIAEKTNHDAGKIRLTAPDASNWRKTSVTPTLEAQYNTLSITDLRKSKGQSSFGDPRNQVMTTESFKFVIYYELLNMDVRKFERLTHVRFVLHIPRNVVVGNEELVGEGKKPVSMVTRFDYATTVSHTGPPYESVKMILDQARECFAQLTVLPMEIQSSTTQIVPPSPPIFSFMLYLVSHSKIEKFIGAKSQVSFEMTNAVAHGCLMVDAENRALCGLDGRMHERLLCDVLPRPNPGKAGVAIRVHHCTVREDLASLVPIEFGVPCVALLEHGDTLGTFWKRLLDRLSVPSDVAQTWRPALFNAGPTSFFVNNQLIMLDAIEADQVEGAPSIVEPRRPVVTPGDYDSVPLWNHCGLVQSLEKFCSGASANNFSFVGNFSSSLNGSGSADDDGSDQGLRPFMEYAIYIRHKSSGSNYSNGAFLKPIVGPILSIRAT